MHNSPCEFWRAVENHVYFGRHLSFRILSIPLTQEGWVQKVKIHAFCRLFPEEGMDKLSCTVFDLNVRFKLWSYHHYDRDLNFNLNLYLFIISLCLFLGNSKPQTVTSSQHESVWAPSNSCYVKFCLKFATKLTSFELHRNKILSVSQDWRNVT